ncbi:hypothetical protein ABTH81_21340, partial [Acinetobacter baumannii]
LVRGGVMLPLMLLLLLLLLLLFHCYCSLVLASSSLLPRSIAEEMLKGYRPISITYALLINLASKSNDFSKALQYYRECVAARCLV